MTCILEAVPTTISVTNMNNLNVYIRFVHILMGGSNVIVGRIRQETQVNVNWNDNGQCTQQDVHLAHIIFGNVVLDETDDTLRFLIISVRKPISIELDYLSLKVLDLLRARVEVFTNLLGFDD
jgi:hypothetical protein